jgi:hypothetical protein
MRLLLFRWGRPSLTLTRVAADAEGLPGPIPGARTEKGLKAPNFSGFAGLTVTWFGNHMQDLPPDEVSKN